MFFSVLRILVPRLEKGGGGGGGGGVAVKSFCTNNNVRTFSYHPMPSGSTQGPC